MSTDAVSRSTTSNAVVPHGGSKLEQILATARAINARPTPLDPELDYFVAEVLGTELESAKKAYKLLMKQLHPQAQQGLIVTPAEAAEINDAYVRTTRSWAASDDGKKINKKGSLTFGGQSTTVASVIIMAAKYADSGLRNVRQSWDAKVADGTVDRVKTRVAATASDLFAGVGKLAAAGWQAAISRTNAKKD